MTVGQPLLAARRVSRRFGTRLALRPTDLEVRGGERVALLGPNGAGKSTLLSLLAGALAPSGGVVEQPAPTRIGWAPQRPGSYGRLSARENLELFARLEKLADAPGEALRALDAFGLPRDSVPSADLSVGNRQRLNLAIALLGQPDVLLLDEPTASLDPQQRRRLWDVCAQVTVDGGAVVFATQNVDELESNAERVVVLREGALVFDGSFEEYRSSEEAHALG